MKENTLEGSFRADLYHRLSVYPVHIPPLRDRDRDVLILAGHFLEFNRARLGVRGLRLSRGAEHALMAYPWPGNVRELEHVISRAAIKLLSRGASRDQILTIPPELLDLDVPPESAGDAPAHSAIPAMPDGMGASVGDTLLQLRPLRVAMDEYERMLIERALETSGGNWSQASRTLALDSSNLHKRAKRLGLKAD